MGGYLVLCRIDLRYDFLHLTTEENDSSRPRETSERPLGPVTPRRPHTSRILKPRQRRRDDGEVSAPPIGPPSPSNRGGNDLTGKPRLAPPVPNKAVPDAKMPARQETPPAIVTLKLDDPVIHIVAESDQNVQVTCDVGFSHNLLHRGDARDGYEIVAKDLGNHGKKLVELGANITGAGAAIEITMTRINKNVRCDLKPLFSLPSGDIEPLTITRGTTLYNKLTNSLAVARAARDSLPQLHSNLSQLQSALRTAQQAMGANGRTPGETGAGRTAATIQANNLNRQIIALNRRVTAAERLSEQEPALAKDLQSLNQISEYAKGIASASTVSVRFHIGDQTIPASEK